MIGEAAKAQGAIVEEVEIDTSAEGYAIYQENGCINCHGENLAGGAAAPSLVANELSPEEIADIAVNGKAPGMPAGLFKGTDEELEKLSTFISEMSKK